MASRQGDEMTQFQQEAPEVIPDTQQPARQSYVELRVRANHEASQQLT